MEQQDSFWPRGIMHWIKFIFLSLVIYMLIFEWRQILELAKQAYESFSFYQFMSFLTILIGLILFNFAKKKYNSSKGGTWKSTVFFSDDPQNTNLVPTEIRDKELIDFSLKIEADKEAMLKIWVFKNPLVQPIPPEGRIYHQFVVIKSTNWHWSFEKTLDGILVQRFDGSDQVTEYCHGQERLQPVEEIWKDYGNQWSTNQSIKQPTVKLDNQTIFDIFDWLHRKDHLNNTYNVRINNCQDFSHLLYESATCFKEKRLRKLLFYTEDADNLQKEEKISLHNFEDWNVKSPQRIQNAWIFKVKSTTTEDERWSLPKGSNQREFIILESTNLETNSTLFWSFDKIHDGICVQRGQNFETLKTKYRGKRRQGRIINTSRIEIETFDTIRDNLYWIYFVHLLNIGDTSWKSYDNFGSQMCKAIVKCDVSQQTLKTFDDVQNFYYFPKNREFFDNRKKSSEGIDQCLRDGCLERIFNVRIYTGKYTKIYKQKPSLLLNIFSFLTNMMNSDIWQWFVVIQSTNWYWSFEKQQKAIVVRRFKRMGTLRSKLNTNSHEIKPSHCPSYGETINDVLKWIHSENYLNSSNYMMYEKLIQRLNSSQSFAMSLYDAIVHAKKSGKLYRKESSSGDDLTSVTVQ